MRYNNSIIYKIITSITTREKDNFFRNILRVHPIRILLSKLFAQVQAVQEVHDFQILKRQNIDHLFFSV